VRDLGDRGGLAVAFREAINAGELVEPRILAATAPLTPPGGHCWFLGGEVAGAEQFRQRIHHNAAAGADVIKVMVSGGSMTPGGAQMWQPQFSTTELRSVVEEAHRLGLPVAAHAHGTSSIRICVDAGVDTIEHCTWLTGPGVFEPSSKLSQTSLRRGSRYVPPTATIGDHSPRNSASSVRSRLSGGCAGWPTVACA
jgi:imidazolonepropionase-like amidohydrolase